MIQDNDFAKTSGNFDRFGRLILDNPRLFDPTWPWVNLQTSVSVFKGGSCKMAPDQVSRLQYHPHRRYDAPNANYTYFESQESRKCAPSFLLAMSLLPRNLIPFPNWQQRSTPCLPFLVFLVGRDREAFLPSCLPKIVLLLIKIGSWAGTTSGLSWQVQTLGVHQPLSSLLEVCRLSRILVSLSLSRTNWHHRNRRASHQERVPRAVLHAYAAAALNV
jgi:hypothetical protein